MINEYLALDDDDEPTMFDGNGLEYGVCLLCQELTALEGLSWDGLCEECNGRDS